MFKAYRYLPLLALLAGALAAPACASYDYGYRNQGSSRDFERRAYQNGFDRGVRNGERDARDRRSPSYSRDSDYRDADDGYYRDYGLRDEYRRVFRQGYEVGYTEGYNRVARAYGAGYPRNGYPGGYGSPNQYPAQRAYGSRAVETGYRDGYEAGRDDGRDRNRYDPRHPKRYREGDHDYNSRYGSLDEYKREYRSAFERGYEAGYRENARR